MTTQLTRDYIMALTAGREADWLILEHVFNIDTTEDAVEAKLQPNGRWVNAKTGRLLANLLDRKKAYSTDPAAVYEAEAELEWRGLHLKYIFWQWYIRHASPLDCCKAMLLATMEAK